MRPSVCATSYTPTWFRTWEVTSSGVCFGILDEQNIGQNNPRVIPIIHGNPHQEPTQNEDLVLESFNSIEIQSAHLCLTPLPNPLPAKFCLPLNRQT